MQVVLAGSLMATLSSDCGDHVCGHNRGQPCRASSHARPVALRAVRRCRTRGEPTQVAGTGRHGRGRLATLPGKDSARGLQAHNPSRANNPRPLSATTARRPHAGTLGTDPASVPGGDSAGGFAGCNSTTAAPPYCETLETCETFHTSRTASRTARGAPLRAPAGGVPVAVRRKPALCDAEREHGRCSPSAAAARRDRHAMQAARLPQARRKAGAAAAVPGRQLA